MTWDHSVDFLVVGSGGGGMTAAIRAHDLGMDTLLIEKAPVYGGSTAWSGGVIWVPDNTCMSALGMQDSQEEGLAYLEKITEGKANSAQLRAYVAEAPRMMKYLEQNTYLQFISIEDYPDYYPELKGGKFGGRSCEPKRFDALRLGDEFNKQNLHEYSYYIFGFLTTLAREGKPMMKGSLAGYGLLLWETLTYLFNIPARLRGRRNTRLTLGGAIVARARLSLMDRKVPLWLNTSLIELITEEGKVVGVLVEKDGKLMRIQARRGVLLAMGGFEQNEALREKYQQAPTGNAWTAGAKSNTGDAIAIGEKIGADLGLMDDAWWSPVFKIPEDGYLRLVIFEKNLPGGIIVNKKGARFMNEAAPYNDIGKAIYAAHQQSPCIPAYLVFDRTYRNKYPVGKVFPGRNQPDWMVPKYLKNWMQKDKTLSGLAKKIGVDAEGLLHTVDRFNEYARAGIDADFHRGESAQDRYYTLLSEGPNPSLAPLERGPYYAVPVWPGDLGTKGGLKTDEKARVISKQGDVVEGLYATGNCTAVVMGHTYPGAGGTIGPSMTFGFIAAEHAAQSENVG